MAYKQNTYCDNKNFANKIFIVSFKLPAWLESMEVCS